MVISLKTTMVIPSYWSRESRTGWREGDLVYDHPTPLDREGTLLRALRSIGKLDDRDFQLVIVAVPTNKDIALKAEKKIAGIIRSARTGVETFLVGPSCLAKVNRYLANQGKDFSGFLSLSGYPDARNICIFTSHILGSDVAVLLDEDEVVDSGFMTKATEFIGRKVAGRPVYGVAGYYTRPDGEYHIKRPSRRWMRHWGQVSSMNKAFNRVIRTRPRLKETPFVFGGNMVIHRRLFTDIPFDPNVPRGEDIDYLINARMFGYRFYLDNELSVRHLPPGMSHPAWQRLREDICRFVYERHKLLRQRSVSGMKRVRPGDLDPYPGHFLRRDLQKRIEETCRLLSIEYLKRGDSEASRETLMNIELARTDAVPEFNPFQRLCQTRREWKRLIRYTGKEGLRSGITEIIRKGRVR